MAEAQRRPDVGDILGRTSALFGAAPGPALAIIVGFTAAGSAIDMMSPEAQGLNLLISIAALFAQFLLIQSLLAREGMLAAAGRAGRAASFVGAGIVTGLAISLGLVLLVLPGIYLLARWSVVDPLIIGEGMKMSEAMSESWSRTRSFAIHIALAFAAIYLPWVLGVALLFFTTDPEVVSTVSPGLVIVTNLLIYAASVVSWYAMVAVSGFVWKHEDLGDIFA